MAGSDFNCPNCGAPWGPEGECAYCGTVSPKADIPVDVRIDLRDTAYADMVARGIMTLNEARKCWFG